MQAILKPLSDEYRDCLETNRVRWHLKRKFVFNVVAPLIFSPTYSCSSVCAAATRKQLLIKCLAQAHPWVIKSPPPGAYAHTHAHTHTFFQIHLLCDKLGWTIFFLSSSSNAQSETTSNVSGLKWPIFTPSSKRLLNWKKSLTDDESASTLLL